MNRCIGALVNRCIGAMVNRCIVALVNLCIGASVHWCIGESVHRCIGVSVHCESVHWRISALVIVWLSTKVRKCRPRLASHATTNNNRDNHRSQALSPCVLARTRILADDL